MLKMEVVSKVYRTRSVETTALRNFSQQVSEGEFVAVTGPSGSGKTTFLSVAGPLESFTSGEYWLDGTAVRALSDDRRSRLRNEKIGFVFQAFNLIQGLCRRPCSGRRAGSGCNSAAGRDCARNRRDIELVGQRAPTRHRHPARDGCASARCHSVLSVRKPLLITIGVPIGVVANAWTVRTAGAGVTDGWFWLGASAVMIALGQLGALEPALRAAAVPPAEAIRSVDLAAGR